MTAAACVRARGPERRGTQRIGKAELEEGEGGGPDVVKKEKAGGRSSRGHRATLADQAGCGCGCRVAAACALHPLGTDPTGFFSHLVCRDRSRMIGPGHNCLRRPDSQQVIRTAGIGCGSTTAALLTTKCTTSSTLDAEVD